jgi:hypothetical protein
MPATIYGTAQYLTERCAEGEHVRTGFIQMFLIDSSRSKGIRRSRINNRKI